jgi:hypothetical protein
MPEHDPVNERTIKGARQALFYLARAEPLPPTNALLTSPLVYRWLAERQLKHDPENAELAVQEVLRGCVNEYGLREPEDRRQKQVHRQIFEILSNCLLGRAQTLKRMQAAQGRSYDRHHSAAVQILAECLEKKERTLRQASDGDPPEALSRARARACELEMLLRTDSGCNLLALGELDDVAGTIADLEYHPEARRLLELGLVRLQNAPDNLVVADLRSHLAIRLAHSLINLGCIGGADGAIARFRQGLHASQELRDGERIIHATHMLGVTHSMIGDRTRSVAYHRSALDQVWRSANPLARRAWIERDLVSALLAQGDNRDIPAYVHESLSLRERLGDVQGTMMTLEIWSKALMSQGELKRALSPLWHAHDLARHCPLKLFRMMVLVTLADLHFRLDDARTAYELASAAEQLGQRFQFWHQLEQLNALRARNYSLPINHPSHSLFAVNLLQ